MTHTSLERDIWRCVDGELSEAEEQRLLMQLDEVAGWRSLALAFLEQRLWRDACREEAGRPQAVEEHELLTASTTSADFARERRSGWRTSRTQLVAAMTLLAAGLGFFAGRQRGVEPGTAHEATGRSVVAESKGSAPQPSSALEHHSGSDSSTAARSAAAPTRPHLNLRFVGQNGQAQTVPVPVYSPVEWDEWAPAIEQPFLPPDVREALRQSGYVVDELTELVTVPLDQRHHVALPVSTVRVRQGGI